MFYIVRGNKAADFLIEEEAFEGVRLIADTVSTDIEAVCDRLPDIRRSPAECASDRVVLAACAGRSGLLDRLEREGRLSLECIRGRREVYMLTCITSPFEEYPDIKELLVIAGSDKRGTIYGMFRISELIGVSPLIYFGDAVPQKCSEPCIDISETVVSKEPSVKYRGFFINDEWPAFGNWCTEKFGGINAKAYRKIFELLLRMKGNYMWPAMWRSSFSEDGPGLQNAELADKLGVVIGLSHHEPMCRSGVEWQLKYKDYGDDSSWSFISNSETIAKFWEDGILRNRPFENVITIGMRGENDSKLMPADATLKDNIEVIKKAIRAQHELIKKHISPKLGEVPRMLAIYKEVEDYYFGDGTCEGLKDWDELKDVIFLLSDDNHGNLRALPTDVDRNHPGGFGMYYHFDYHGAPISYEWTNCVRLTKTWEQMTQAYEAGVREMWIVNVGDLKEVEYPLSFFMELAYDFGNWGSSALNKIEDFVDRWLDIQFADRLTAEQRTDIKTVLEGYTRWNSVRTPEAMRTGIYHPVHFREGDRVRADVTRIMETAEKLNSGLTGPALTAYQSMIYYPAVASLNLVLMYLDADLNTELAGRGCIYANILAERVRERAIADSRIVDRFHRFNDGKWNHCLSSDHTGFRSWDANNWTYPIVGTVCPIPGGKIAVSFRGSEEYHLGAHWQDRGALVNDDFTVPGTDGVLLDIDSRGRVSFSYELEYDCPWLISDKKRGRVETDGEGRSTVSFTVDRTALAKAADAEAAERHTAEAGVLVRVFFDNGGTTFSKLLIRAAAHMAEEGASCTASTGTAAGTADAKGLFIMSRGLCVMRAEHYCDRKDVGGQGFRTVDFLGREGAAVKAFPAMTVYENAAEAPYVKYSMTAEEAGEYALDISLLTRNPSVRGGRMRFALSVNDGTPETVYAVSEKYYTEWMCREWYSGVLEHARTVTAGITLEKGRNDIYLYAGDPGVIFEKLTVRRKDTELPESYFGPVESCRAVKN